MTRSSEIGSTATISRVSAPERELLFGWRSYRLFRQLLDLVCPPHCAICGKLLDGDDGIALCVPCRETITTPDDEFCERCGGRKFERLTGSDGCRRCVTTPFLFRRVIALGEYEHDLRRAVLRMKTDRSGFLATALAAWLVQRRRSLLEASEVDVIVSVPMHRLRRWERGVNNPDRLAEELSFRLQRPHLRNVVRRIRRTDLQYPLSRRDRIDNVLGAFDVAPQRRRLLEGKNVLLVDDILTTGATCNELAGVFHDAGARSVTVCVAARAEGKFFLHDENDQNTPDWGDSG